MSAKSGLLTSPFLSTSRSFAAIFDGLFNNSIGESGVVVEFLHTTILGNAFSAASVEGFS